MRRSSATRKRMKSAMRFSTNDIAGALAMMTHDVYDVWIAPAGKREAGPE